jgi:hypothetical protein
MDSWLSLQSTFLVLVFIILLVFDKVPVSICSYDEDGEQLVDISTKGVDMSRFMAKINFKPSKMATPIKIRS